MFDLMGPGPLYIGAFILALAALLLLYRAMAGPTVFDRIVAGNGLNTITLLLIVMAGYISGRPAFHDIAIAYALLSFTGLIVILRFVLQINAAALRKKHAAKRHKRRRA